jgi:hypothetical protein
LLYFMIRFRYVIRLHVCFSGFTFNDMNYCENLVQIRGTMLFFS